MRPPDRAMSPNSLHQPRSMTSVRWKLANSGLGLFDGFIACVLGVVPLLMGGAQPIRRLVYVVLVGCLAIVWLWQGKRSGKLRYRPTGLESIILLGTVIVICQLLPLPHFALAWLSPRLSHFLPLWAGGDHPAVLGQWRTVSVTPQDTRIGLLVWAAHAALLTLLVQRLETSHDSRRLLRWIAAAGIWLALIGLLQYLFCNGKFLWIYQNPFRDTRDVVRGPFYNENHFAHFLALTLAPLWVWLRSRKETGKVERQEFLLHRERTADLATWLLVFALAGVLFAILLTRSRGGMVMAVLVAVLSGAAVFRRRGAAQRGLALGLIGIILVALSIHGLEKVGHEFQTMATTSLEQWDQRAGRRNLWRAASEVLGQFTLSGAGVGSFRETFPLFYAVPRSFDYSYAESGFLQVAVETGLLGLAVLAAGLYRVGCWLWQFWRSQANEDWEWVLAAAVGLCISGLHSIFDFVWYIPACMSISLALLAVLIRWTQIHRPRGEPLVYELPIGGGAIVAMTVLGICGMLLIARPLWPTVRGSAAWHNYLLSVSEMQSPDSDVPVEPDLDTLLLLRQHLTSAVDRCPGHARAHLRLASLDLRLFEFKQRESENPMSLSQIRDAALASKFPDRASQDRWLQAALGTNRRLLDEALLHATRAVSLSPFQGVGYIYLAELQFLHAVGEATHPDLIRQALRVRPFDPQVLFAAGREAIFAGDLSRAIRLWRRAYHQDDELRQLITAQLAPRLPANVFIEQFALSPSQLIDLHDFYCQQQLHERAESAGRQLLDLLTARFPPVNEDAVVWRQAYAIASQLRDRRAIVVCRRAVQLAPDDYAMRRRLAFELLDHQDWSGAIRQLDWCRDKNRADRGVAVKLDWARQQLKSNAQSRVARRQN